MLFDIVNFAWRPGWRLRRHSHCVVVYGVYFGLESTGASRKLVTGWAAPELNAAPAAAGLTSPEYPQDPRIDPMIVGGEVSRNITLREIDRNRDSRGVTAAQKFRRFSRCRSECQGRRLRRDSKLANGIRTRDHQIEL